MGHPGVWPAMENRQRQEQRQPTLHDETVKDGPPGLFRHPPFTMKLKDGPPGFFRRRIALLLLVAEGDDGVDFGGAVGGEPGGYQGYEGDDEGGGDEGEWVGGAEAEELRLDGAGGG
jgi:hypothetical protein